MLLPSTACRFWRSRPTRHTLEYTHGAPKSPNLDTPVIAADTSMCTVRFRPAIRRRTLHQQRLASTYQTRAWHRGYRALRPSIVTHQAAQDGYSSYLSAALVQQMPPQQHAGLPVIGLQGSCNRRPLPSAQLPQQSTPAA